MAYFIFKFHRGTKVKFQLINRDSSIPLAKIVPEAELRKQLDHVKTLKLRRTDLYYLRGMDVYGKNMFDEEFLTFLSNLQLGDYKLERIGDQYDLSFNDNWETVTFWETIALAIISELYYRELMKKMSGTEISIMYGRATGKLYDKLKFIADNSNAKVVDFGLRRRHSFLWQKQAIEMAMDVLGPQFVGTSNAWMAFNNDLIPIGTNAHELPMVVTALAPSDEEKKLAQYKILLEWEKLYGKGLRIMLPDTYGSAQFFSNMPSELAENFAHNWNGQRQDSGDPLVETARYYGWLKALGVDNETIHQKLNIFSDGLDDKPIVQYWQAYQKIITPSFGWGTKLTNDFVDCVDNDTDNLFRPFSVVCKVVEANGNPAVKLSNNIGKATGPKDEVEKYIKIFGNDGRGVQAVEV